MAPIRSNSVTSSQIDLTAKGPNRSLHALLQAVSVRNQL
jgi:hypothetical protein